MDEKEQALIDAENFVIVQAHFLEVAIQFARHNGHENYIPSNPNMKECEDVAILTMALRRRCDDLLNLLRKEFTLNQRG